MLIIKRHYKFLLIIFCFFALGATERATSLIMEYNERGSPVEMWKPFVWEYSSTGMIFLLVPLVMMFDQSYPIASKGWLRRLLVHIPLSMLFSFSHVVGMVAIRKMIFVAVDDLYIMSNFNYTILYEYRKDILTYASILIVIYAYREILRLRNGEAQFEKTKKDHSEDKRILVSKSGRFNFIDPQSVDWVEAAGNYVELHVGTDNYMLRATMKEIENKLGEQDFARIHRSTIVKKDQVKTITPTMSGDKIIILNNGQELRLSRRYNENLALTI